MTRSEELFERAKAVIPGGVSSPVRAFKAVGGTPLFVARAEGARFWDEDGRSFVDYVGSWGPMILGHAHPAVLEAIRDAASRGTSFGAPCALEVELAERVVRHVPSVEKVRFVSSGTEATMSALRVARGFTGRRKILKFDGCYHGHADSLLVAAGSGVATLGIPGSPGVPEGTVADTLVVPYNDVPAVERVVAAHGSDLAAVIVEPVCGNMGTVAPKPGYLEALREITRRNGTVLDLRRGHDRLPPRPGRGAAALRHPARHDLPRQDRRRRPAGRGLRRPRRHHGHGRARGPGLPGGHALGEPAGDGRGRGAPGPPRAARDVRHARGPQRASRGGAPPRPPATPARR